MSEYAVVVDQLTRRFGAFTAVDHISLSIRKGEIFGFLGPNGAGKSTTIRMLCGILAPTSGSGTVAGLDIRRDSEKIKANIGYMSQRFSLYEDLTVEENLDFYAGIYGIPRARQPERKAWALRMAGLEEHRDSLTAILPTGWRQRLSLGCAVLHEPPIVFLDEPTSGVDPMSRRNFWDLIYALSDRGVTVFVTTHYMEEAEYCERLALIYRGRMIALGTPEELRTREMKGQIIEVKVDRPSEAIELAGTIAGVREAALFGGGLHLVTDDPDGVVREARAAFEARGHHVGRIAAVKASLEDVFVSLIEEHDAESAEQGEVAR